MRTIQHSTDPARTGLLTAAGGFLQQRVELCSGGLLADQAGKVGESGAELPRAEVGRHPGLSLTKRSTIVCSALQYNIHEIYHRSVSLTPIKLTLGTCNT